jgi:predicted RNA methylase
LDLDAGLGIPGFIAAELGPRRVFMVEPAAVIEVTRQAVQASAYADRIECFRGVIEELKLPEPVDVILSVFTGNFLLTEDLLPSLFHARDRWLKPGGFLLPDAAVMAMVPVSAPEYYQDQLACWAGFGRDWEMRGYPPPPRIHRCTGGRCCYPCHNQWR